MNCRHYVSIIVMVIAIGCGTKKHLLYEDNPIQDEPNAKTYTNSMTICAVDLSEDMSPLSTHNDEILTILHPIIGSDSQPTTHYQYAHTFRQTNECFVFNLASTKHTTFNFVLIEKDSDHSDDYISNIVVKHADSLKVYFKSTDYTKIRTILGVDDVLDFRTFSYTDSTQSLISSGIHKMDKFEYSITFEFNE